jgi:predicted peptidase
MSRNLAAAAFVTLAVATACTTKATPQATQDTPATAPCACAGLPVAEGVVDAACGASVCLETAGYRCADDGLSVTPDPAACPHNWSGGTGGKTGLAEKTLDDNGAKRIYGINVPPTYTGEVGVPLVLHFHGWRPAPAEVKEEVQYLWKPVADEKGFITVAPEGSECPELNPKGDPFLCFNEGKDDAWLDKLVATVSSQYNIDKDRIFLSGHSGGSFFVQGFALLHPEKYRAAITFAGGCISSSDEYGNSCSAYIETAKKAKRKIPYYILHNPGDKVVSPGGSRAMATLLKEAGFPVKTYFTAYEAGSNGHSIDPKLIPGVWEWAAATDPKFVAK